MQRFLSILFLCGLSILLGNPKKAYCYPSSSSSSSNSSSYSSSSSSAYSSSSSSAYSSSSSSATTTYVYTYKPLPESLNYFQEWIVGSCFDYYSNSTYYTASCISNSSSFSYYEFYQIYYLTIKIRNSVERVSHGALDTILEGAQGICANNRIGIPCAATFEELDPDERFNGTSSLENFLEGIGEDKNGDGLLSEKELDDSLKAFIKEMLKSLGKAGKLIPGAGKSAEQLKPFPKWMEKIPLQAGKGAKLYNKAIRLYHRAKKLYLKIKALQANPRGSIHSWLDGDKDDHITKDEAKAKLGKLAAELDTVLRDFEEVFIELQNL